MHITVSDHAVERFRSRFGHKIPTAMADAELKMHIADEAYKAMQTCSRHRPDDGVTIARADGVQYVLKPGYGHMCVATVLPKEAGNQIEVRRQPKHRFSKRRDRHADDES